MTSRQENVEDAVDLLRLIAIIVGLGLLAAFALGSCSHEPPVESGYIRERKFEPAHWEGGWRTEYRIQTRCRSTSINGKYTSQCGPESVAHQVWEDQHEWINDRWKFKLEECVKEKEDEKQTCRSGWRSVTELEYERYRLGQHYPNPQ